MPDDTDKKRRQEEEMIKTMLMSIVFSFPLLFLLDFICVILLSVPSVVLSLGN
jgi:hypothetical protein